MRLFALKNIGLIQNSYHYLEIFTYELDNVLKYWNERRQMLRSKLKMDLVGRVLDLPREQLAVELDKLLDQIKEEGPFFPDPEKEESATERLYYDMLSTLNENIERKLIDITASMEVMGPKGSGHIMHDIVRANYFIDEFNRMVDTLEVGNLHGWINYTQFADRGMRPTFNMIRVAGERLKGLKSA